MAEILLSYRPLLHTQPSGSRATWQSCKRKIVNLGSLRILRCLVQMQNNFELWIMNFEFFSTFASETVSAQWGGAKGNSVGRCKMLRIRNSARCCDSRPIKPARCWHIRVYVTKTTDRKGCRSQKVGKGWQKRDKSEDLPLRASHKRCYAICTCE